MPCGCGGSKKQQAKQEQQVGPNGKDLYWRGPKAKRPKSEPAPKQP